MPKIVNIQYNPALSVKENAKKNHVSETSIRNYIQKNNLDRRHDRKQNIIADCKKYLKKHPNTSRNELQRITGHSLSTIRKYWKYISTEETLTDFNPKKQQKRLLRQEHNFYATHPSVTQDLLREEQFHSKVLEPFCGGGSMAEVIKQNGYEVEAYDLVDRGYGKVGDFFTTDFPKKEYDIITNPPYDDNLIEIVKRCLSICKNKVAILLPIQYLSGKERYSELYTKYPPVRVYIYCERINIAKGGDFDKYSDSGANMTIYAWYVWEKGFKGSTELQWIHNVRKVKEDTLTVNDNKELKRITAQEEEKKKQIEYLRSIPREVIFDYLEKTTTKEGKKITVTKDRELWSDVLRDIPLMFETADSDDISELKEFLYEKPEMPMLFVGSGGQQGSYPALLYGMNKGIGMSLTPLRFAALSDDTIRNSRIVLLSKSGGNSDIDYASKRAIQLNPDNTACITTRLEKVSRQWKKTKENKLLKNLNGTSAKVFLFHHPEITSGFTSVRGKFYKYALYYRAFSGVDSVSKLLPVDLEPEHCFKYQLNHDDSTPVSLEWIEHFCVLFSGYGEPVAQDFESVMTEAGVCSVQICDYRNYCHGRFIFPSNFTENTKEPRYRSNVAMVLFVSPRDKKLAESIRKWAIPSKTPVIIVETPYNSALATIDLLVKSNVLIGYICEQAKRINPYEPNNYNAKDVDKRYPITNVKFRQELKDNGELQYVEANKGQKTL